MPGIKPPSAAGKLSAILAKGKKGGRPPQPAKKLKNALKLRVQKPKGQK